MSQTASSIAHRSIVTLEDRFIGSLLLVILLFAIDDMAVSLTYNMDVRYATDLVSYDSNGASSPFVFTGHCCVRTDRTCGRLQ
jgi:hypothetical protein